MAGSQSSRNEFEAGPWKILITRSHILKSKCERGKPEGCQPDSKDICDVCKFSKDVQLPSLPEMVFPGNSLQLEHECGCVLEFLALEALKLVENTHDPLKVPVAEEWSRTHAEGVSKAKEVVKPFDWTFTTNYMGTTSPRGGSPEWEVVETDERINYAKLKTQERIYFYDEVILYEDELADNGTAVLSAKIRVMASGFFILMRFFMRVDGLLIRMNDTRIYHEAGTNYLLREYSCKEAKISELKVPKSFLTEPNKLNDCLPIKEQIFHKLTIPNHATSRNDDKKTKITQRN